MVVVSAVMVEMVASDKGVIRSTQILETSRKLPALL